MAAEQTKRQQAEAKLDLAKAAVVAAEEQVAKDKALIDQRKTSLAEINQKVSEFDPFDTIAFGNIVSARQNLVAQIDALETRQEASEQAASSARGAVNDATREAKAAECEELGEQLAAKREAFDARAEAFAVEMAKAVQEVRDLTSKWQVTFREANHGESPSGMGPAGSIATINPVVNPTRFFEDLGRRVEGERHNKFERADAERRMAVSVADTMRRLEGEPLKPHFANAKATRSEANSTIVSPAAGN